MTMATAPAVSAGAGSYLHWGVISISMTNLLIIVAMVVLFVLAILLPFPGAADELPPEQSEDQR
jgi:drug/metabolite transporter superfamily protein YnfA